MKFTTLLSAGLMAATTAMADSQSKCHGKKCNQPEVTNPTTAYSWERLEKNNSVCLCNRFLA
jgi:hypothetical protein